MTPDLEQRVAMVEQHLRDVVDTLDGTHAMLIAAAENFGMVASALEFAANRRLSRAGAAKAHAQCLRNAERLREAAGHLSQYTASARKLFTGT
jgi:hypothetical protein